MNKKVTVLDKKGNKLLEYGKIGKGKFKYGIKRYKTEEEQEDMEMREKEEETKMIHQKYEEDRYVAASDDRSSVPIHMIR